MPTAQMNLPYIVASQAQKEVTHNEALNVLDVLAQLSVLSATTATPPGSPAEGDSYIVPASPTGAWAGQAGKVAAYYTGWIFHTPREGWLAYVRDTDKTFIHNGTAWAAYRRFLPAGSAAAPALTADADTDTGLSFPSADTISISTGGVERAQITGTGLFGVNITPTARLHVNNTTNNIAASIASNEASKNGLLVNISSTSYASDQLSLTNSTTAGTGFNFITCISSGSDTEFRVRGDGTVFSDGGTAMSTPADYADAFEWEDGNPENEDRVGFAVVVGREGKIRKAMPSDKREDIIGIISGNPSVCGRTAWNGWSQKYLRDDFNRPIWEEASYSAWEEKGEDGALRMRGYFIDDMPDDAVVPEGAVRSIRPRRALNPAHNPQKEDAYIPRLLRKEWDAVGLCGCLPLRKGQPTHPRWVKLRTISNDVEEWLVR